MTLATKIAVLKDGLLQQAGTPAEIYNQPANIFVADFMGSPAMNLIKANLVQENDVLHVEISTPKGSITLPAGRQFPNYNKREVIFGIRPEAITDPDGVDRYSKNTVSVACHVDVVEPAGSDTFAIITLGGKHVVARLRADAHIIPNSDAHFVFNLDKAVFFDPETELRIA